MEDESITLLPCKIVDKWIAPIREAELFVLDWETLRERFSADRRTQIGMRTLKSGNYIGRFRNRGKEEPFVYLNNRGSNSIKGLLKQYPRFPHDVIEIYKVVNVLWGSRFSE